MNRLFLTLGKAIMILSVMFPPSVVSAAGIAAVQSLNIKPYNNALTGFKSVCDCKVELFIVSEMQESNIVKKVKQTTPDVIIAIGIDALNRVSRMKDIPIVYLMVLNARTIPPSRNNITGVSMNIAPGKQLELLKEALPGIKRIGLLYDPAWTGNFVKKAKLAAPATGIKIMAKEIRNSKDYPFLLESMKGKIDVFWMLPDLTAVTPETVEFLFLFSMKNSIPVITFSNKYLEMGALMSLDIDAYDIGKQAGEMVKEILSGTDINKIAKTGARTINVTINRRIAKKQGIKISDEILDKARLVNGE